MGEEVRRPVTEGVGVKPITPKPTLSGMDSMFGQKPITQKPLPFSMQQSPAPQHPTAR